MQYLKNAWYVAAMHDELPPGKLLARTYLGEPVALFRDENGEPRALADLCPHRFAALSDGIICDGGKSVRCRYHGLAFDGAGKCVHNPQGAVPKAAVVKSYVTKERHGLIWLWPGDPELADEGLIPDYSVITSAPDDATIRGYMETKCNYQLFVDNILDLSHVDYLHPTTLGSGALSKVRPTVSDPSERSVHIVWLSSGDIAPRAFDMNLREQGKPTDQWTEVTWTAPSNMMLRVGATLMGEPEEAGACTRNLHMATPETENTTHYWYWTSRNFAVSAEANAVIKPMVENVFTNEDKPMLEMQQKRIKGRDFDSMKPVLLPADVGTVRVRRKLAALMEAESAAHQAA